MPLALVAQWIEHLTTDQKVVGSTPAERAIRSRDLSIRRQHIEALFVGLTGSTISLSRQLFADSQMFQSIWAEDGWMPMCVVANGHGACLRDQVNGYWPIVHRGLSEIFALAPLAVWPYVFPVFAALLLGLTSAVVYLMFRQFNGRPLSVIVAIGVALTPSLRSEFINVVGNVHWVLFMTSMIVITGFQISQIPSISVSILIFVASLTNPVGFIITLTVTFLWLIYGEERHALLRPLLLSLLGWLFQLAAILAYRGTERIGTTSSLQEKMDSWANSLLGVIPGLRIPQLEADGFQSVLSQLVTGTFVAATLGLLGTIMLKTKSGSMQSRLSALGLATQALAGFLFLILEENPRYTFVLISLNTIWIVGLLSTVLRARIMTTIAVLVLVVAPLPAFKASSYRITHSSEEWFLQVEHAQAKCADGAVIVGFVFAPENTYLTQVPCESIID